ncbi:MAG TPA: histidine triad nucleotide-binding protein [Pseudomonadales bacterium]|jgi:histidine triad (HIT) family protein|nr:histidine triad nucleotide-binding protein [Pseudomonadales bacterium]MCP5333485.1 histidine triad nucleotide-binding protein [Pseudomonadales bacterium]HMU91110.1 histidine triad nucleotide-binding protein [Pseudomonadales bacterium]HMW15983.1 histidine triad nucleotide-binding protein [Pseudomonadales bacterium]HMY97793.1 histidine triad nucleotide-binding protein [Pseudomonadales bacterium]
MNCLFCKIASGEISTQLVHEDDEIVAFNDINPQAPQHILLIPRRHITTLNDLEADDTLLMGRMIQTATQLAKRLGFADTGFRTLFNCNQQGGQSVYHIHLHLLAGRQMRWPPG